MPDTSQTLSGHITICDLDPTELHQVVFMGNPDVQATTMDGETVLLDLSTGRYYTLNRIGSLIWELCTGTQTISDIHEVVCNRFDVVPERAIEDLVTVVNQLVQEGLLQPERR